MQASRAAVRPRTTSAGAFDTLADDPKARARSKLPPKPNQGSHQESRNPKVAPSNKPLSEQKRVIKLKFAQVLSYTMDTTGTTSDVFDYQAERLDNLQRGNFKS